MHARCHTKVMPIQNKLNFIRPIIFLPLPPPPPWKFSSYVILFLGGEKVQLPKGDNFTGFLLSTEIPFPCPHEAQLCWRFPRWPTDIHLPEPAGTSSEGERVIVSHVRSVLRSSSETTKQVAVCVFAEPVYKWGTEPKPPAHSTRPQKAEGEQGPRSLLSAAGFSQQSSDL